MKFIRALISLLRFDRTNWTALALCVFAAGVFWIFNALNKSYATNLSLPFHLTFDETKYAPSAEIPAKLTVNVNGNGWELLRKSLDQKSGIFIPLEHPTEVHRVTGTSLAPQVIGQLGALQLNFVVLDTLHLAIEERVTRQIKIKADISNVTYRNNVGRIGEIAIKPDSILLEGPVSLLAALPDTLTLVVPRRLVGASYREELEVALKKSEFIKRDPPVVEVRFEVGPIAHVALKLPLSHPHAGITVDRDSIAFTVTLPQRDVALVTSDSSSLSAILPTLVLQKGDSVNAIPLLSGLPPFASLDRIDTVLVTRKK